jgi:hypothetical protein
MIVKPGPHVNLRLESGFHFCPGRILSGTDNVRSRKGWLFPILSSFSLRFQDDKTLAVIVPSVRKLDCRLIRHWRGVYPPFGDKLYSPMDKFQYTHINLNQAGEKPAAFYWPDCHTSRYQPHETLLKFSDQLKSGDFNVLSLRASGYC